MYAYIHTHTIKENKLYIYICITLLCTPEFSLSLTPVTHLILFCPLQRKLTFNGLVCLILDKILFIYKNVCVFYAYVKSNTFSGFWCLQVLSFPRDEIIKIYSPLLAVFLLEASGHGQPSRERQSEQSELALSF